MYEPCQPPRLLSLAPAGSSPPTPKGEKVAAALAVGCSVPAQSRNTLEFCLAWDMPQITFGSREKEHSRYVKQKEEHMRCVALQRTSCNTSAVFLTSLWLFGWGHCVEHKRRFWVSTLIPFIPVRLLPLFSLIDNLYKMTRSQ